jgi:hypothetical protein
VTELGAINVPAELIRTIATAPSGEDILAVCLDLAGFLCEKNLAYGNAAFEPINIFCKADAETQVRMAIDNKLNRLLHGSEFQGDDTLLDLAGYIVILYAIQARNRRSEAPVEPVEALVIEEPTHDTTALMNVSEAHIDD